MAKQPEDIGTQDMFQPADLQHIHAALKLQHKTLQRKINTEGNPDIKRIYEKQQAEITVLANKLTGAL
ncbi:hypothetical protein [Apis mellifera associated microvirus 13]|nr:hypothetical protein [Apis mellifera associated microvirus 13]